MAKPVFPRIELIAEAPWPRATRLHAALSSAAVYAELARICGTWNPDRIEQIVQRKLASLLASQASRSEASGCDQPDHVDRKKSFHATQSGSRLKEFRATRIQEAFPRSNIMLWWKHPLAEMLCNPQLSIDSVVEGLRGLPRGGVRECIWAKARFPAAGFTPERLNPWGPQLINSLERIGTGVALFALIARHRFELLLGNLDGASDAAQAAWKIMPTAIARRPHLLVAKDGLIRALDYFLSWQPFADARLYQLACFDESIDRYEAVVECETIWLSDTVLPLETKLVRRRLARAELVPEVTGDLGWWNMLIDPGRNRTFSSGDLDCVREGSDFFFPSHI